MLSRILLACLLIAPAIAYSEDQATQAPTDEEFAKIIDQQLGLAQVKFEYERELKIATIRQFFPNMRSSAVLFNCDKEELAESIMQSATEVRQFIAAKTNTLITEQPKFKAVAQMSEEEKDQIVSNIYVHLSGYWFGYKDASAFTVKLHNGVCEMALTEANQIIAEKAKALEPSPNP